MPVFSCAKILVSLLFVAVKDHYSLNKFLNNISLSTVVLNSRDRYENVWLPKMHLEKQTFKITTRKTNYNYIGTTLTTL